MALTVAELRAYYSVDESALNDSIGGIPGKIKGAAAKVAAAGLVIGGAVGAGLLSGMENERVNDKLAAQLALSEPQSKRAGQVAGQLYAGAYGESLGDVSTAVGAVMSSIGGMRDASAADLQALTANALDFAAAFEVDVARSAQIAGQMITTGLAKDGAEAFDLLTAASQRVPAAVREDVLDAADEYGQFFASLGYDGEQAFSLLVAASEKGMYGIDKAGDALKEFTIRSTDMSKASTDAYEAIGLDAQEMANSILAGGDKAQQATRKIIDGLLGIENPADRANASIALFGTPLEDLGTQDIPKFLESLKGATGGLGEVAGAADRMGEALNDNASTNIESFKRQAKQAFVNVVGGAVLPVVDKVASALATGFGPALEKVGGFLSGTLVPALKSAADWMARNETPIKVVAGLIAAVFIPHLVALAATATVTKVKVVASWVAQKAAAIGAAAAHSGTVLKMVAGWVLMGAQALLGAAKMAAAWLIAMGPVGWIIATVVALVALIVANWDTVVAWTKKAWSAVTGALSAAWQWIKDVAAAGAQRVMAVVGWFGQLPGRVAGWFGGIRDRIVNAVSAAWSYISGIPGKIKDAFARAGQWLLDAGRWLVEGLWNGIKGAAGWLWNKVKGWVGGIVDDVLGFFGIGSPSKVFADMGRWLAVGLAQGIDRNSDAAVAAALRTADAVNGAMATVEPPDLAAMGNAHALGTLTARRPAGATFAGAGATGAGRAAGSDGGGYEALVKADTINIIDGTPDDLARRLSVEARTRGTGR